MASLPTLSNAVLANGFCAYELDLNVEGRFRTVVSVGTSKFLALDKVTESVMLFEDTNNDGFADTGRVVVAQPGLNHGLALYEGYLYATTSNDVFRWTYDDDTFSSMGKRELIISNMNDNHLGVKIEGDHVTRTMAFDNKRNIYISVGSVSNVDPNTNRAKIRRFQLRTGLYPYPTDYTMGETFVEGLRNEVGLAFDSHGVLWGVENSADNLKHPVFGDITEDNPADELNRFRMEDKYKSYGYPHCWTEYSLDEGLGKGTVWAWPGGQKTDAQCRKDYIPPTVAFQAHSAPLGIVFYKWNANRPASCGNVAFPQSMNGYAFVAFHGSWNRDVPTGYKVVYIPFDSNGNVSGDPVDLLAHQGSNAQWENGFRPVDVDFDRCGRLIVTSDGSGEDPGSIVIVSHPPDGKCVSTTNDKKGFGESCVRPDQCLSDRCALGTCQRPFDDSPKLRLAGTRGGAGAGRYQKTGTRRLSKQKRTGSRVRGL